jgi:hypothetical protein
MGSCGGSANSAMGVATQEIRANKLIIALHRLVVFLHRR